MADASAQPPSSQSAGTAVCIHCGTPFSTASRRDTQYCCNGCEYVHKLIRSEGLEHYYELRDQRIRPVTSAALHPRDYRWLETRAAAAERDAVPGQPAELLLDLSGISCVGCVWLIEKVFRDYPGAVRIEINVEYGQVLLQWRKGIFQVADFAREIQQFGYLLGPAGERSQAESRRLFSRMGVCAALALNAMLFTLPRYLGMQRDFALADLFELLAMVLATLSLLIGGSYFIVRGFRGIIRGIIHIDFPIAVGVIVAWTGSVAGWLIDDTRFLYFDFVAIFIFLMLAGRWLQERTLEKNRHALLTRNHAPEQACIVDLAGGSERMEPLDAIQPDMCLRILPGEVVPVQCELDSNTASISLEWINGESAMSRFRERQLLPAGALNIGVEPILVRSRERWADSQLRRLLSAQPGATRDRRAERFLRVYLLVVLAVAVCGCAAWVLAGDAVGAAQVLISVLVVSCPCAIGVALPLAHEWAVLRLRDAGLFVRSPMMFAALQQVRHVVFDKTGTLTMEAPEMTDPAALDALQEDDLAVLTELTRVSLHPVSRALYSTIISRFPRLPTAPTFQLEEVVGFGLVATTASRRWVLGRPGWNGEKDPQPHDALQPDNPRNEHKGDTCFLRDGTVIGRFSFVESVREDAAAMIATLQRRFAVHILSGDRTEKVSAMAAKLRIPQEHVRAELIPQAKADYIDALGGDAVFFVGDGANDALAFSRSGVRATPATPHGLLQDKADCFFTGRSLQCLLDLFAISRLRSRALRAVMAFAILYNCIAVAIALSGHMHPLLAAILMPLSSITTMAIVALVYRS